MMKKMINNELKVFELSLIWSEAKYNFAFWENLNETLDWDKAYKDALPRVLATDNLYDYYMELSRFISLLRDGHTRISRFPQSLRATFTSLPIDIRYLAGHHVIVNMDKSLENDIKPFSIIKKFDGVDIFEYIEKNLFPYYWHEKYDTACDNLDYVITRGTKEDEVELALEFDGVSKTVSVKRRHAGAETDWAYSYNNFNMNTPCEELQELYASESHTIKKTKDNIGIITIDTFSNDNLGEEFCANQEILENIQGFIIDVRSNYGGSSPNGDAVAKAFIAGDFPNNRDLRPVYIGTYRAWAQFWDFGDKTYDEVIAEHGQNDFIEQFYKIPKHIYYEDKITTVNNDCPFLLNAPLVVLSSCNTGSAAEDFLVTLDQAERAVIIGTASGGSTGQPLFIELESGGSFQICTHKCKYPDGREFINIGVQPHIKCEMTLDDYINGSDSVMNRGLEEIRSLMINRR